MALTAADKDLLRVFRKGVVKDYELMQDPTKTDFFHCIKLFEDTVRVVRFWAHLWPKEFGELSREMEVKRGQLQIETGLNFDAVWDEWWEDQIEAEKETDAATRRLMRSRPRRMYHRKPYKRILRKDW